MTSLPLAPAAQAFDAIAARFDERFGEWASVAAQRRAVRAELLRAFPSGSRILEIGGGTGEDAVWLMQQGRTVQLTDPSPAMIEVASRKLTPLGAPLPRVAMAEQIGEVATDGSSYDGAFSNFAALNCVADLTAVARGLARCVRSGGTALIVIFGTMAPGEWLVELVRGRPRAVVRRFSRGDVSARLGGGTFTVRYHRRGDIERAFAPYFGLAGRRGIGVFVPPSAAEPWISRHPRVLASLEEIDRLVARPCAALGDHVLYELRRSEVPVAEAGG